MVLNVEVRERTGTGGARDARREGKVPGVLYGGTQAPVAIAVRANEFRKALYTGKLLGHLVTLKHGSETQPVIAKAIQVHPVTDEPIHFDLYRVDAHQQIKISVPVHFTNHEASPGIKRGGTLNIVAHEIELLCPADQIPEELSYDLEGLDIGDAIRVSAFALPAGVVATADQEFVVAIIAGSSAQASEEAGEGEEGSEAAGS
ncbi:50S ribosomal protein L25/general stress protein Ctc [Phenylobacterium sp.]|uniref:50S ribosomal protein L25/general stress protein Ctc n=1 Tax=Phenylobacterium sp. TaxID=1871053 RepID=UPI0027366197|nr:50S ribosomal protein L25/general stress protein Ctc [Phenylobacterium sp.]MDP3658409.1 50S ribosomal protein L25/general stress protein Ctc [Phenylobacterium sp.]